MDMKAILIARRPALRLLAAGALLAFSPRARAASEAVDSIDLAMAAGIRALIAAQSADGAWRSSTYGALKDGLSLTPPALKALAFGPEHEGVARARRLGAEYLIGHVRADGSIDDGPTGLIYPVYSAAMAAIALDRLPFPGAREARDAWIGELRRRQLTAELGWTPDDPAFGGWGYTAGPPLNDEAASDPPDANLSATLCAVGALRPSSRRGSSSGVARIGPKETPPTPRSTTAVSSSRPATPRATRRARPASTVRAASGSPPTAVRRPTACGRCSAAGSRRTTRG